MPFFILGPKITISGKFLLVCFQILCRIFQDGSINIGQIKNQSYNGFQKLNEGGSTQDRIKFSIMAFKLRK